MSRKPAPPVPQTRESWLERISSNCGVVVVVLFAFGFIFQNFLIPSSSMASTLLVGDHVLVERSTLAPPTHWARFLPYRPVKRGDIIVFHKPVLDPGGEYTVLVKRVIGIPGDRIHLRDGIVYRNGIAQNEPWAARPSADDANPYVDDFPAVPPSLDAGVTAGWFVQLPTCIHDGDVVVPPDSYFVMGDNRERSLDSRYWGFVPRQNILGRPILVLWSIDMPETGADDPSLTQRASSAAWNFTHFLNKTRWSRTLHRIQ
jgi:signal peptidase I